MNKVILSGNVGDDPQVRATASGKSVANFSLATNKTWKDQNGDKAQSTQWHKCVCWDKQADLVGQYVKKGKKLLVVGELTYEKWSDNNGVERTTAKIVVSEIEFLSSADGQNSVEGGGGGNRQQSQQRNSAPPQNNEPPPFSDDDIPF